MGCCGCRGELSKYDSTPRSRAFHSRANPLKLVDRSPRGPASVDSEGLPHALARSAQIRDLDALVLGQEPSAGLPHRQTVQRRHEPDH